MIYYDVSPDCFEIPCNSTTYDQIYMNHKMELTIFLPQTKEEVDYTFHIGFPWGMDGNCLTSRELASGIFCKIQKDGWNLKTGEEAGLGLKWILTGQNKEATEVRLYFSQINMIAVGITCLLIKCGDDNPYMQLPIIKQEQKLSIESFKADSYTVTSEESIHLSWSVLGAERCTLNPGDLCVRAIGNYKCKINKDETFSLQAYRGRETVTKQLTVYVKGNGEEYGK